MWPGALLLLPSTSWASDSCQSSCCAVLQTKCSKRAHCGLLRPGCRVEAHRMALIQLLRFTPVELIIQVAAGGKEYCSSWRWMAHAHGRRHLQPARGRQQLSAAC